MLEAVLDCHFMSYSILVQNNEVVSKDERNGNW